VYKTFSKIEEFMTRRIIVADLHGCLEEFQSLLDILNPTSDDVVYLLGDILDKGPHGPDLVNYLRSIGKYTNIETVLGNHDRINILWDIHETIKKTIGITNPLDKLKNIDELRENAKHLNEEDYAFLRKAKLFIKIPEHNLLLVHGGIPETLLFLPTLEEIGKLSNRKHKSFDQMVYVRYLREGKFVYMGDEKAGDYFWADKYDGRFGHVLFGHTPWQTNYPMEFKYATGLDLGCCFGNNLCAAIYHDNAPGKIQYQIIPALDRYKEENC